LRQAIDALGLQYTEAAKAMGITKQRLGNWMSGRSPISAHELSKFCHIHGVTADWVLLALPGQSEVRRRLEFASAVRALILPL
jgi:transcriptional regulator with XRE-family HTH domain